MRQARLRAGMTQKEWAVLAEVTVHAVRGWERDGQAPSIERCLLVAQKTKDRRLINETLGHIGVRCELLPEEHGEAERRRAQALLLAQQLLVLLQD